jgi:septal ring factor EnvC (AmiA/AmiB activator)
LIVIRLSRGLKKNGAHITTSAPSAKHVESGKYGTFGARATVVKVGRALTASFKSNGSRHALHCASESRYKTSSGKRDSFEGVKAMATQDLQSLKAELHDVEGELHRIAAKIERIDRELAAGQTDAARADAEMNTARDERVAFEARRMTLQDQITELEKTLENY